MINNLILLITRFLGDSLADVVCGLILILAIYWFWRYDLMGLARLTGSLRKINGKLNTIDKIQPGRLDKINRMLEGKMHPVLNRIWSDYCNALEAASISERNRDSRAYFSTNAVITIPASRKKVEAVPGMLMTVGALGTILGFAAGSGSSGAGTMQGTLAAALSTSIAAAAAAVVFQILDRMLYHQAESELEIFHTLLYQKTLERNSSRHMEVMLESLKQQTESLQDIGTVIGTHINGLVKDQLIPELNRSLEETTKRLIEPFVQNTAQAIHQLSGFAMHATTEGVQKMTDRFIYQLNASTNGQLKKFGTSIQELCESQRKTKEDLDLLIKELVKDVANQKEINQSSQSIVKTITQYHQQILESSREMTDSMESVKLLAGSLSEVTNLTGDVISKFHEQRLSMQKESEELFESMIRQSAKMQEGLDQELEKVLGGFAGIASSTFDRMESNLSGALDRLTGNAQQIRDHNEELLENVSRQTVKMQEGLDQEVEKILARFTGTAASTFDRMENSLSSALDRLAGNEQQLREYNEKLLESISRQTVKMQEGLDQELEKVLAGFAGVTSSTFDRMANNLSSTLDRLTGSTQQIREHMEIQTGSISLSAKEMAKRIEELNKTLESSVKEFNSQVHAGMQETFVDFDKELGQICTRLSHVIAELIDAVDELPMVIEAFKDNVASA